MTLEFKILKSSTNMRIKLYATIVQLIVCLYFILLPVDCSVIPSDGLALMQNASELITITPVMKTDSNLPECKCTNGTCLKDGNKTECVCDPGFGKISKTVCKACDCGEVFGCLFDVGIFSTSKMCLCGDGFVEKNGVCQECNCGKNGICELIGNGTKICRCDSGYLEINGYCEDCACGIGNTTCQMIDGTKFCACPSGYRDNRGICEDINECQLPRVCPSHSHCINTPGSFECTCEEGYEPKSNVSNPKFEGCQDIDECLNNKTCPFSATLCVNLPGSYKCVCNDGYQPINAQVDPRYTRCRENNASWHHVNIVLIVLLALSMVTLLGVMLIKKRRSVLMSRNVNAYDSL